MGRFGRNAPAVVLVCGGAAGAQSVDALFPQPHEDRWNYAFNPTPGVRTLAPTFGAIGIPGFDDYDGQFVIGFDTSGAVTPGLGAGRYHVESIVVRATVANDRQFAYDPSPDSFTTFLDAGDPQYLPDADPGRPVEMFIVGYRPPFAIGSWAEDSPYGGAPVVPPAQGNRFIFAGTMDDAGAIIDVSNRLKERFDVHAPAVGRADLTPGDPVPADTEFTFDVERCAPGLREHVAQGLNAGVLRFTIASLQPAAQGGEVVYPVWYTRENTIAQLDGLTASLEIRVRIGAQADLSGPGGGPDGAVDSLDFFAYLDLFASGDARADLTGSSDPNHPAYGRADCTIDGADFFFFLDAFAEG